MYQHTLRRGQGGISELSPSDGLSPSGSMRRGQLPRACPLRRACDAARSYDDQGAEGDKTVCVRGQVVAFVRNPHRDLRQGSVTRSAKVTSSPPLSSSESVRCTNGLRRRTSRRRQICLSEGGLSPSRGSSMVAMVTMVATWSFMLRCGVDSRLVGRCRSTPHGPQDRPQRITRSTCEELPCE